MKQVKNILVFILALAFIFGSGFLFGRRSAKADIPAPQIDTVIITDTIVDTPEASAVIPAGYELVPVGTKAQLAANATTIDALRDSLLEKPTLVTVHDTTFVMVPLSRKTFTDGKTYQCEVEGYDVKMLWHKSYQETKYITETVHVATLPSLAVSPVARVMGARGVFFLGGGVKVDVRAGKWCLSPGVDYGIIWAGNRWDTGPMFNLEANYSFILK